MGKLTCKHCAGTRECGCKECLDKVGVMRASGEITVVECQRCKHGMKDEGKYNREMCGHCFGAGACGCSECN